MQQNMLLALNNTEAEKKENCSNCLHYVYWYSNLLIHIMTKSVRKANYYFYQDSDARKVVFKRQMKNIRCKTKEKTSVDLSLLIRR